MGLEDDHIHDQDETPIPGSLPQVGLYQGPDYQEEPEARELTDKEWEDIYPNRWKSGENPKIKQAPGLGECYFALGLATLQESKIFKKFLDECIKKTDNGWELSFWGADFPVLVESKKINRGLRKIETDEGTQIVGEIQSKNDIDRIIERAYAQYEKMRSPDHQNKEDTMSFVGSGGFSHHFLKIVLGPYYDNDDRLKTITPDDDKYDMGQTLIYGKTNRTLIEADKRAIKKVLDFLEKKANDPENYIICCGTPAKGNYKQNGKPHERIKNGKGEFGGRASYIDQNGKFVAKHAYGVKNIKLKTSDQSGENENDIDNYQDLGTVDIINPWDTTKLETISIQQFLEIFRMIAPVHILDKPKENTAKKRIKLKSTEEREFTDQGRDYIISAGTQIYIVSQKNGTWTFTNTEQETTKLIQANQLGKKFTIGRSSDDGSAFMGYEKSLSRYHFEITFFKHIFRIKTVSERGKTYIKESQETREEEISSESAYYDNDNYSKRRRQAIAQNTWSIFKEEERKSKLHQYKDIDKAEESAKEIPVKYDESIMQEMIHIAELRGTELNNRVPENPEKIGMIKTQDGVRIIFYIQEEKYYFKCYNPRLSKRPTTGQENLIEFLNHSTNPKTKNEPLIVEWAEKTNGHIHLHISPKVFEKCIKKDLGAFGRLEPQIGKSVRITVGGNEQVYLISKYNEGDYGWSPEEKENPQVKVRKEVQEVLKSTSEKLREHFRSEQKNVFGDRYVNSLNIKNSEFQGNPNILKVKNIGENTRTIICKDGSIYRVQETFGGKFLAIEQQDYLQNYLKEGLGSKNSSKAYSKAPIHLPITAKQLEQITHKNNADESETVLTSRKRFKVLTSDGHQFIITFHSGVYEYKKIESDEMANITMQNDYGESKLMRKEILKMVNTGHPTVFKALGKPKRDKTNSLEEYRKTGYIVNGEKASKYNEKPEYTLIQTRDGRNILFEVYKKSRIIRGVEIPTE